MKNSQLINSFWLAATTVLVAQPSFAQVVQVTGVQLNSTEAGIEVILETPAGEQLQVLPRIDGNTYIANIPNTQLRLPSGNTFRQDNPIAGITAVTVTNQDANSIRVTVTGSEMPTVQLFDSEEGLILGITAVESGTEPQPTPETPQKPATAVPEAVEELQEQVEPEETPAEQIQGSDEQAEEDEPIEIVVTGEQETGYVAPNATTATRTDTPLLDTPASIQVIPQQVIEDQGATDLSDALRNVSGVVTSTSSRDIFSGFTIRGFEGGNTFLRNGIADNDIGRLGFDFANVERLEVLKGPASVLYGQITPGGIINIVTEKPLPFPFYSAEATYGSFNTYQGAFDLSGPLNESGTLLYRLNALATTSSIALATIGRFGMFFDFSGKKTIKIL